MAVSRPAVDTVSGMNIDIDQRLHILGHICHKELGAVDIQSRFFTIMNILVG